MSLSRRTMLSLLLLLVVVPICFYYFLPVHVLSWNSWSVGWMIHHRDTNDKKPILSIAYYYQDQESQNVRKSKFFSKVVPALCQNSSGSFKYNVIIGLKRAKKSRQQKMLPEHRSQDDNKTHEAFSSECSKFQQNPKHVAINFDLKEIQHDQVTKAINSMLFEEAYMLGHDYYFHLSSEYKLNKNWDLDAVTKLKETNPRGTGVVIVSADHKVVDGVLVHRTHFDLYNRFYPLGTTDFKVALSWMTSVYGGQSLISGFSPGHVDYTRRQEVYVEVDKRYLQRYLKVVALGQPSESGKRVVAMSLYGDRPKYTIGAIRNAQLIHVNFPGWLLRVYTEKLNETGNVKGKVPRNITKKLESLGAQIVYVDLSKVKLPGRMWRFYAFDDLKADYVISRDSDSRLTRRDAVLVHEWIKSGKTVHVIRDHKYHKSLPIQAGMMGVKPRDLRRILNSSSSVLMKGYTNKYYMIDGDFLRNNIWEKVPRREIYYHDSISCKEMGAHPVPMNSSLNDFVGAVYFHQTDDEERIGCQPPVTSVKECVENKYEDDGPLLI